MYWMRGVIMYWMEIKMRFFFGGEIWLISLSSFLSLCVSVCVGVYLFSSLSLSHFLLPIVLVYPSLNEKKARSGLSPKHTAFILLVSSFETLMCIRISHSLIQPNRSERHISSSPFVTLTLTPSPSS